MSEQLLAALRYKSLANREQPMIEPWRTTTFLMMPQREDRGHEIYQAWSNKLTIYA